jgi:hypothetical protein
MHNRVLINIGNKLSGMIHFFTNQRRLRARSETRLPRIEYPEEWRQEAASSAQNAQ